MPLRFAHVDEVPDDQEVGVEAHPVDDAELHLHPLDRGCGRRVAVALAQALHHAVAQVGPFVLALGQEARDQLLARARSRRRSARRSRRWTRAPRAIRRTPAPSPRSSAGRTRSSRRSSSALRACSSSARTAAPCDGRGPPCAGSARRRCRRSAARPRGRCGRCPRWRDPARGSRSSGPRSRRSRARPRSRRSSAWARASSSRPSASREVKRAARQPVRTISPSACASSCPMSTVGLPRLSPSRKPVEQSLTRLRYPAFDDAISVRWLRSAFARSVWSSTK